MESSFLSLTLQFLLSNLIFGIIGAGTFWIILKWANQQIRFIHLIRGAASWILGPLVVQLISNTIGSGVVGLTLFALYGFMIGFIIAISSRISLKQADLLLSWNYVLASGATWGVGFTLLLCIPLQMWGEVALSFGIADSDPIIEESFFFIMFILSMVAGSSLQIIGLEKYRINSLNK